jgi:lipoprotein signal peptidase
MNYDYLRTLTTLLSIALICYFLTMINANFAYAYLVMIGGGVIRNIIDKKESTESIDELIKMIKTKEKVLDKKDNPFKVIDEEDSDD